MISPQATAAAQKLQGIPPDQMLGAVGDVLSKNFNMPLAELFAAHKLLTQQQQEQEAERAKQMAMAGAGLPGLMPQQTTVAQQVTDALAASNENLEQEIMASAAQPDREGGIANLNAGGLGRDYANGGIVAFTKGELVTEQEESTIGRGLRGIGSFFGSVFPSEPRPEIMERQRLEQERLKNVIMPWTAVTQSERDKKDANVNRIEGLLGGATTAPADRITEIETYPGGGYAGPSAAGLKAAPAPAPAPAGPKAASAAEPASPYMEAVKKQLEEMRKQEATGRADLDRLDTDPTTGKPVPKKTLASFVAEQDAERKKALKDAGVPEQGFKERIDELSSQAKQAREDRSTDRWLALAQGFFAMGAGQSQYAMTNMAQGLGVTTKQLGIAENEYRKGEKARLDSIATLKQAQRAEVMGQQKEAAAAYKDYNKLQQDEKESKRKSLDALGLKGATLAAGLATSESARAQTKALKEMEGARLASTELGRREDRADRFKADRNRYETAAYLRAQKEDPQYRALVALNENISRLSTISDPKPRETADLRTAITQHNKMQADIETRARAVALRETKASSSVQDEAAAILARKP